MPAALDADVLLHGRHVGSLRYEKGGSRFTYTDDLTSPRHHVLGQVFEDDPGTVRRTRVGIPPWFANLLPEGALRQQIEREMGGGRVGDFTLLACLGSNLPGAVTVRAPAEPEDDLPAGDVVDADHPLRQSLAGVQLKYSVRADRLTFPASGRGGWWIVKLPDRSLRDLAANEYLTMSWLRAAGLDVPPVNLVRAQEVSGIPEGLVDPDDLVFLVERFDRTPAGRIHVEDFAQVADVPPRSKYSDSGATYDSLAAAVLALTGDQGYREFVRRLVAMVVVGNTDAHLKNWALRYPGPGRVELAPVYDFHSLSIYDRFRYAPLALSLNGEVMTAHLEVDDFRRLADRSAADSDETGDEVVAAVQSLRDAWSAEVRVEAERRFPALAKHYDHRLATLPICLAG